MRSVVAWLACCGLGSLFAASSAGSQTLTGYTVVSEKTDVTLTLNKIVRADCPDGTEVS